MKWSRVSLMSELDSSKKSKQTVSAKVNCREGNSPEYMLK